MLSQSSSRVRSARRARVMRAMALITLALTFVAAAPAAALVPLAAESPSALGAFPGPSGSFSGAVPALPELPLAGLSALSGDRGVGASSAVDASDTPLAFEGGWYWVGNYLNIDGWVTNDTSLDAGLVLVHFVVQTGDGVTVVDDVDAAAIYNLHPGESATFKAIYELPDHAGEAMAVGVETLAAQPTWYPDAVYLTRVGESSVTNPSGIRKWTFVYRNDSAGLLENPILGAVELNAAGEVFSTMLGTKKVVIAPGQTVSIEAYGFNTGDVLSAVDSYCQALPLRLDPVFRFYNRVNGTHFYTASAEERDQVIGRWPHVYTYEGIAYHTNPRVDVNPLYRFYYLRGGSHFYTASAQEANLIIARWPSIFRYEGPSYTVSAAQAPGSTTVYRFVNRKNSSHFYTASVEEVEMVKARLSSVYIYEGPAFWVAR